MQTGKKFDDLISKAPMPKMPKGFWARFDAELGAKLDRAEIKRISVRSAVLGVLEDLRAAFANPEFKRALATASAAVMVVGFSIIFAAKGGPGLYPVSSLTSEELVDEIVMLDAYPASENIIDF
jgi:hypothetical protein